MVQPAYAEPCVPPGQVVVVIAKAPPDALTVTVAVLVVEPVVLVAVNVYVVVAVGLTLVEPVADVDVKVPGVMAMLVAPEVIQLRVLLLPEVRLAGSAVKEVMAGTEPVGAGAVVEPQPARPIAISRMTAQAQ